MSKQNYNSLAPVIDETKDRPSKKLIVNPLIQIDQKEIIFLEESIVDEHGLDWFYKLENQRIKLTFPKKEINPISLQKKVELTAKRLAKKRKELLASLN